MRTYKSYYAKNRILSEIANIIFYPIYLLSKILPRKNIIIFGSMSGYSVADNSKYLFINTYQPNYYWITKNKSLIDTPILPDVFPIYAYSWKGIYLQLHARIAYYTHKVNDFFAPAIFGAEIIALWHGVPFKKIGTAVVVDKKISLLHKIYGKYKNFRNRIMPYSYFMWCDKVYCPDKKYRNVFDMSFSIAKPSLIMKPYPRVAYAPNCKKERQIIYCPTYRRHRTINDVLESVGMFSDRLVNLLKKENYILVIRPHPIDMEKLDTLGFPSDCIRIDKTSDIYASIKKYAMLITDYSSLFYDSQALGIKTFLLADDIYEYNKNEEGLFDSFLEYIVANHFENMYDLIYNVLNEME